MAEPANFDGWSCPLPLRGYDRIMIGHGGGGKLSAELVDHLFLPALSSDPTAEMRDSALVAAGGLRLAFSTDSYVVRPLFFPGGSIGDLAVNGTVNDVAMSGAQVLALSSAFILEEGLELSVLGEIAMQMGKAARAAGVQIVTGDTKVVESGQADGVYINTSGFGIIPAGVDIRPSRATHGDVIIVSGLIGSHGIAVMSKRESLEFEVEIMSDSAPLNGLVAAMISVCPDLHVLRDPTRGGVAASLCEIAAIANVGIEFDEASVPVHDDVASACAFLGLDPLSVANEGKLIAIVAPEHADAVLEAMRAHEFGRDAARIGTVVAEHARIVVARTSFGARRVVDLPLGEQLPRIC